jgi:hypothetical protein
MPQGAVGSRLRNLRRLPVTCLYHFGADARDGDLPLALRTNGAIQRDGNTIVQMDITRSRTDGVAVYLGIGFARGSF